MKFLFLSVCITFLLYGCVTQNLAPTRVKDGVRFSIKAPKAKKVTIAGGFNQWDTNRDALSGPDTDGVWHITLLLAGGRYEYLFLVNNKKWVLDPTVSSVSDGLGARNSIIFINKE